jgi:hypothetical protein
MSTELLGPARDPSCAPRRDAIVDAVPGNDLNISVARKVAISIDVPATDELALVLLSPSSAERLIDSLQAAVRQVNARGRPADEFLRDVVEPALELLGLNDAASRALLMGTAAVESELKHVRQLGGGPARGYFQMEPDTALDLLRWLERPAQSRYLQAIFDHHPPAHRPGFLAMYPNVNKTLVDDPIFAAMLARLRYRWIPTPLPDASDVAGMAKYWKRHYNTRRGKGTVEKFVERFALVADALAVRERDIAQQEGRHA